MSELDDLAERWAELRRQGVSIGVIGRQFGVTHQWVSRVTAPWGPFPRAGTPTAEQLEDWVAQRRSGRAIERVARSAGVSTQLVAKATAAVGPFPRRLAEPGWLTVSDIAPLAGVSLPTVLRWCVRGIVPAPDKQEGKHRLWREATITAWLKEGTGLEVCPICGARSLSAARHAGAVHRP